MTRIILKISAILIYGGLLLFGVPLLLGIADYERNGQDPMKRNLIDMVSKWHRFFTSNNKICETLQNSYSPRRR